MTTKIGFVSSYPNYWWAGCEDLWSKTALWFLRDGYRVAVNSIEYKSLPEPIRELKQLGAEVTLRHRPVSVYSRIINRIARYGAVIEKLWINKYKPDFMIISEGDKFEAQRWMEVCLRKNIPYVIITQACTPWIWPDDKTFPVFRELYRRARRCFFVAEENMDLLRLQISDPLGDAKIIRNPFRADYHLNLPWPQDSGQFRLACIATAEPGRKGQDLLLRVIGQDKWKKRPVQVSFFSHGGFCEKLLREISGMLEIRNVNFAGVADDSASIWSKHHALVLPSRREGLPLVVVEAMLCGRVCIVTDVGGNKEIIEDNLTGFVATAPTIDSLDEAMERAWQRRGHWEEIGRLAARRIRELVPADPVAVFVQEIKTVLRGL